MYVIMPFRAMVMIAVKQHYILAIRNRIKLYLKEPTHIILQNWPSELVCFQLIREQA